MYVLTIYGRFSTELQDCEVEARFWPNGQDGNHHTAVIPFDSNSEALQYMREYRRILYLGGDIEDKYNFGRENANTARSRMRNDWLPLVDIFITAFGPYRIPIDVQRQYNNTREILGMVRRVFDDSYNAVYHSDDGVEFFPVTYVLGGWLRVGDSVILKKRELT